MTIHEILQKYWGHQSFRPMQEEIIQSILKGNDTLALLPTGGGKSICFQVPGLYLDGLCIVITPLIALMNDQVENLKKRGISAVAIHAGLNYQDTDRLLDNCIYGKIKFLYVSPERLKSPLFIERFKRMNCKLIAVDESHCISQWGYDFRPPYLEIASIREYFPEASILALTATATHEVIDDIQDKLKFKKKNVLRKSFYRSNLTYSVTKTEDKYKILEDLLIENSGCAVVYVRNRKKTRLIAEYLQKKKISADYYHAGIDNATRNQKQEDWINDKYRVIVATNAFGMGIDKPDVRLVVHMDLPDNLEAYFQEAGRAGRDEKPAKAICLYNDADIEELKDNLEKSFPSIQEIKKIYQAMGDYFSLAVGAGENTTFSMDVGDFSYHFKISVNELFQALRFLEKEGFIIFSDKDAVFSSVNIHQANIPYPSIPNDTDKQLVKFLVRNYAGIFDEFCWINEGFISKKLEISHNETVQSLLRLHTMDILRYSPKKSGFRITYIQPRMSTNELVINKTKYDERKKTALKKLAAVIHYAENRIQCRSQTLLSYFDEKNHENCRKCDYCLNHYNQSEDTFSIILQQLKKLDAENIYLSDLEKLIPEIKLNQHQHLRWLMEHEIISINHLNVVTIHRKRLDQTA
jgi:ATP-dependent DNA helicase RecQ